MDEKEQTADMTEMQAAYRAANRFIGATASPEATAACMQAYAILKLAEEVAGIRKLLESGEGAFTVGIEESK